MKKVNFKFKFVGLNGETDPKIKVHEILAEEIAKGNSGKPQRAAEIARKIYKDGSIELLTEDETMVRTIITSSIRMTDLLKGQLLDQIDKTKNT